jgi:hypothetical protein
MGLPRSTYYDAPSRRADDAEIIATMMAICDEFEVYGYRRVGAELRPADAGENHLGRRSAARDRHFGRADQSGRHVRSRPFADCCFGQRRLPDRGPTCTFFQATADAVEPRISPAANIKITGNRRAVQTDGPF